jgi:hypothetical protein
MGLDIPLYCFLTLDTHLYIICIFLTCKHLLGLFRRSSMVYMIFYQYCLLMFFTCFPFLGSPLVCFLIDTSISWVSWRLLIYERRLEADQAWGIETSITFDNTHLVYLGVLCLERPATN